jgi:hypothetical protein
MVAALICLFTGSDGAGALFRDSDAGWHIRNGEQILATRALPHSDPFSFSKPSAVWIAWEWLPDLFIGVVHKASGLGGVATVYGLAIGASIWMWFRLTWAAEGNFFLACLLAAPMISTTTIHWLARPHVWAWLYTLAAVWWCERAPQRLQWNHVTVIALVSILWTNTHGSFLLGPVIAGTYAAGGYLRQAIWGEHSAAISHVVAALIAFLSSLLNPNGWALHRHVFTYLSDSALIARIGEFQSFNFQSDGAFSVVVVLFACAAGASASLAIRRPDRFLLSLLFTAAALRSARALPLAALAILPLANGSISEILSLARGLKPRLRRALDHALQYGERLRAMERHFHGVALLPVIALILATTLHARADFPASRFPVAASAVVGALPSNARVFAPDYFGGYLIYRFHGERKVFFDGRSDFYGLDFVDRYSRIVEVRPGWREEFARWNFTHALLPRDAPLLAALKTSGWREVYRDRTAVLLALPRQAAQ